MKNVLITGASGGMGLVTTKYLSSMGFHVYALDLKPLEAMDNVTSFVVDLTKQNVIREIYHQLKEVKFDAIIHFTGRYRMDSLIEIEENQFRGIFDVNFFSVYLVNKVFFSSLNEHAKIVMISSELAPLDPLPFNGLYSITKSVLEDYAVALRQELNLLGHQVVIVRPGAVDTGMIDESIKHVERIEQTTTLYQDYVHHFKQIVASNETKTIPPLKVAKLIAKILNKKKCHLVYQINLNPKLKLLSILPKRMQLWIIKKLLSKKRGK